MREEGGRREELVASGVLLRFPMILFPDILEVIKYRKPYKQSYRRCRLDGQVFRARGDEVGISCEKMCTKLLQFLLASKELCGRSLKSLELVLIQGSQVFEVVNVV